MAPLRIDMIDSLEDFHALAGAWGDLVARCTRPSIFLTHEWYECWWAAFGARHRPAVLCAWEGDVLVGAAAMAKDTVQFRGMPVRRLAYPVNGVTGEAGFLITPDRRDVFDALLAYMARKLRWDLLELRRMPCHWPLLPWLLEGAARLGLKLATRADNQVPIIPIAGDWDRFLDGRSKSFRKTIRRRLGRIEEHSEPVRVVRLRGPEEITAALPTMFEISSHSWKAELHQALSDQPRAREFYRLLSRRLGALGRVGLWFVYIGGAPAAFEYHLRFAGITYPIRADFDLRFADLSPGAHLEYEVLRELHQDPAHEITEYNTCADGYAYERKWTDEVRPQCRAWLFKPTLYGRLLHLLSRARRRHPSRPAPWASCCRLPCLRATAALQDERALKE